MNYWAILIFFAVFYVVHMVLSLRQMRDFSKTYGQLHDKGKVVIGKHQSILSWGSIVMFQISNDGVIQEGRRIAGVTVFSRFRSFNNFNNADVNDLSNVIKAGVKMPTAVKKAVINASENYATFMSGTNPQEPLGPWSRLATKFAPKQFSKERV
ncbi:transcriptional regulator GutM [Corynebacterium glutamicum]|uniref:transcriptional regulator GutM n=1 Tax=Corynebacterium glutamicum TaxID=1718 RepID=UPI000B34CB2C|nr:transcriptional regulator GutM [Corynebacterium glutamicum]